MMSCNHKSCGDKEMVWLPYKSSGLECGLKPHHFCTECGLVKVSNSDKPKRLGYYINIIVDMSKKIKITKVQMRLISLELQKAEIDDIYSMDKHLQEILFIDTVRKYVNVTEQTVHEFLHKA
jgi:uncharacterized Zn finger protein